MSQREFLVLLTGLPRTALWSMLITSQSPGSADGINTIEDPEEADAALFAAFGGF